MNYYVLFFRSERTREEVIQEIENIKSVKDIELFCDDQLEDMDPAYAVSFDSDCLPNNIKGLLSDIAISEGYDSECFTHFGLN